MKRFRFKTDDGTELVGWSNEGTGPQVLVCNGLAAAPAAWPSLLSPDCGFEVVGWYQPGFSGSDRPVDRETMTVQDHADDARALLDSVGWDDAILAGWSFGVNTAMEFALKRPDRTTAVLAIGGVPGGTFRGLFGGAKIPQPVKETLGRYGTRIGRLNGNNISRIARNIPSHGFLVDVMQLVGLLGKEADRDCAKEMVGEYLTHDFVWYFKVAGIVAEHERLDVSEVECPVSVIAGKNDLVTHYEQVITWAETVPQARVQLVEGTHFIPIEFPDLIVESLRDLWVEAGHEPLPGPGLVGTATTRSVST